METRQWADLLLALYLQRIYILVYLALACDRYISSWRMVPKPEFGT